MMKENYNTPNSGCCGRPFPTAPENKCNYNDCCMNEYAYKQKACIREKQPDCEAQAVIPSITVETIDGITNLANCLVHVTSTNTTYYVDDKHRIMITWAGPVNIPGYDMVNNPRHFKNQIVSDIDQKIAVLYDNNGRGFTFAIDQDADFVQAVNAKLDEMAEDGVLADIVEPYLSDMTRQLNEQFDTLSDNVEDEIQTMNTGINNKLDAMDAKVNTLTSISPIAVGSVSDMTDHSKLYLLTTDGYWYYWDGSAWAAGGVYNSTPNAMFSIIGSMIASGTITQDKLNERISILSKATAVYPGKSVLTYASGTGPTLSNTADTNVLTFSTVDLNNITAFKIDKVKDGGNNICYCYYDSDDLTSYYLRNYSNLSNSPSAYDATNKIGYSDFTKNSLYDTFMVTVNDKFEIYTDPAKTDEPWKTGDNVMITATNLVTASNFTRGSALSGYLPDHTPDERPDYRLDKVDFTLTDEVKTLLSSASFYIEDDGLGSNNRILLWTPGVGQKMYSVANMLASSAYDPTTKRIDIGRFFGTNMDNYTYVTFHFPHSYNFPVLYTTALTRRNLNYDFLNSQGYGEIILPNDFKIVQDHDMCFYYQTFLTGVNVDMISMKQITNANINTSRVSWFNKDTAGTLNCTFRTKNNLQKTGYDLTKNITIDVVDKNAGSGTKKVLMIGDSLTQNGNYTQRLLDLFAEDTAMDIELLGTKGSAPNRREGRSGWNTHDYVTNSTKNGFTNPFYNALVDTFDFTYYMTQQGYSGVDYVFINLGTNDKGRADADIITDLEIMIDSIKTYDANIQVCLWLPPIRGLCQNVDQNNLLESFDALHIDKLFIDTYQNDSRVNLIPIHTNVNPYLDYPMVEAPISDTGSYSLTYTNNKVHPGVDGYYHIGDVLYAWIKFFAGQ